MSYTVHTPAGLAVLVATLAEVVALDGEFRLTMRPDADDIRGDGKPSSAPLDLDRHPPRIGKPRLVNPGKGKKAAKKKAGKPSRPAKEPDFVKALQLLLDAEGSSVKSAALARSAGFSLRGNNNLRISMAAFSLWVKQTSGVMDLRKPFIKTDVMISGNDISAKKTSTDHLKNPSTTVGQMWPGTRLAEFLELIRAGAGQPTTK